MTLEEFREASKTRHVAPGQKPAPYSSGQREFAVSYAKAAMGNGKKKAAVLRELGISAGALDKWMSPDRFPGRFRRVRVEGEPSIGMGAVIVTPGGYRVEGLSAEALISVLRML